MTKMFDNVNSYRPKEEEFPLKKQLLLFGLGWMGFKILGAVIEIIILIGFLISDPGITAKEVFSRAAISTAVNTSVYAILLAVMILFSNVDMKRFQNSFRTWKGFLAGLIGFAALFGFSVVYGNLLNIIGIGVSDNGNEEAVKGVVNAFPILSFFVIGLIAPVCEELTYRVGLFGCLSRKNKVLAYCIAPLVFALIHFSLDFSNIVNELLNLPYYLFAGFALTYLYDRFGLAGSLTAHVLNNCYSQIINLLR